MLFLGNLYAVTDDGRYKDQILNCAARLAEAYPNFETATSHSDNFTYSRLLGVLSVAQSFGNGIWTPVLDRIIGYFSDLQHPSGGIADGEAYISKDSLGTDIEFAVGLGGRDGVICDLVYCQNSVLYSLNYLISHGVGDYDRKTAKDVYYKLVNFLLDVQIRSSDQRLNGAWMRAFDMENYEYYGCDKDFAWGPYCILTGWVTGSVPLVFLDLLGVKTVY